MPKVSLPRKSHNPSHASAPWRVYFRGKNFWFKHEEDADAKLAELNKPIPDRLTSRQIDEYLHARELLAGTPLLFAVRWFIERNPNLAKTTTVSEAIDAHLEPYRRSAEKSKRAAYLDRMKFLMEKLRVAHGDKLLAEIGPDSIGRLLDAESSDWTRNDLLTHLKILFRRAHKRKHITDDPTSGFSDVETTATKVIMTLEDVEHVMRVAAEHMPELVVPVCFQIYFGIRTEEIIRLDWSLIRFGRTVDINESVAKTKERRVIDFWPPVVGKWIQTGRANGPLLPHPKTYESKKVKLIALCRALKKDFKFGQNALRHTYCSYACAYFGNPGKAMLQSGQREVNIFFSAYRDYRSEEEAKKFFGFLK